MGSHCPLLNSTSGRTWQPAVQTNGYHQEYVCSLGVTTEEDAELEKQNEQGLQNVPYSERNELIYPEKD